MEKVESLDIRRLQFPADLPLIEESWDWLSTGPEWRRITSAIFGDDSLSSWLYNVEQEGRFDVGVWIDGIFSADIIATLRSRGIIELHFEARPKAPLSGLIEAGIMVRDQCFAQGLTEGYTWTPSFNRAVLAMDRSIGFVDYGIRMFKGRYRARPIEWIKLTVRNPAYGWK